VKWINMSDDAPKKNAKGGNKEFPAQTFAEDMSDEWSKDAIKAARDAFALTIGTAQTDQPCTSRTWLLARAATSRHP
jgi:hypothetical protein